LFSTRKIPKNSFLRKFLLKIDSATFRMMIWSLKKAKEIKRRLSQEMEEDNHLEETTTSDIMRLILK
jgi:hypothetical protein